MQVSGLLLRWGCCSPQKVVGPHQKKPQVHQLLKAVKKGDLEIVEALVSAGAELNTTDNTGMAALHWAVAKENLKIVQLLLDSRVDLDARDCEANTALHWAVYKGNVEIVELLLAKGADVNVTCKYELTALHLAVTNGSVDIVKALVIAGAYVAAADNIAECRALHLAVLKVDLEIVELLLAKGADVNVTNKVGRTPVQIAAFYGYSDIVQALVIAGADLTDNDGNTALYWAKRVIRLFNMHDYQVRVKKAIEAGKKELIAQLGALEHDHMWGEKSRGKLAALCNKESKENNHNRGDVLNNPDLQRYIWEFNKNNKPSLRLKKARQYSAEAATKIQAGFRGFKGRNIAKEAKEAAATKIQ